MRLFKTLFALLLLGCCQAALAVEHSRIFLLYSYSLTFPTTETSFDGFNSVFGERLPHIDVEFMDSKLLYSSEVKENFDRLLSHKLNYREPYDLIVAADDNAFNYLLENRERLFPGVPMVFWGVNDVEKALKQDFEPGVTGVVEAFSFRETLDLIRTLLPEENELTLLTDETYTAQKTISSLFSSQPPGLDYKLWSMANLSWGELEKRLGLLTSNDAVLLIAAYKDRRGESKSFEASLELVTQKTSASIFHMATHGMGKGQTGGVQVDFFNQGQTAGQLALRILNGEDVDQIRVVRESPNVAQLDYQVLLQKKVPLHRVPSSVQLINQPQTGVKLSDKQILMAVIILFVLIIVTMQLGYFNVVTRKAKRKVEHSLGQLKSEHAKMNSLLSAMKVGILFESPQGLVEYTNPVFFEILDLPCGQLKETLVTGELFKLFPFSVEDVRQDSYSLSLNSPGVVIEQEEIVLNDGRSINLFSYPVQDNSERALGRLWVFEDITQEKKLSDQLLYFAERDPLTGLYNRRYFHKHLRKSCEMAFNQGSELALIYIDLDNFKYINDNYGHKAGDDYLVKVASEISPLVRSNEVFARLGGDEFAILAYIKERGDSAKLASRVVHAVEKNRFAVKEQELATSCSIGVCHYPEHTTNVEELVMFADIAMYAAKRGGKNSWELYGPKLGRHEQELEDLTRSSLIAQAIENDSFELYFQGVYRIDDGQLSHFEVLLRMRDPETGELIMPGQFIPVAERTGMIVKLDRWVIKAVIQLLSKQLSFPDIAVNLSGVSFGDHELPTYINKLLKQYEISSSRIHFELTETATVGEVQSSRWLIEELHKINCQTYLDDFGTGFSSFSYLKNIEVDGLKIDGQFISQLSHDANDQLFVIAMTGIARGMGKKTVAEFVETKEILELLKEIGVDYAQGFLLDRPSAIRSEKELEAKRHWLLKETTNSPTGAPAHC